jgi:putative membrane protein
MPKAGQFLSLGPQIKLPDNITIFIIMALEQLPLLNAILNGTATILLLLGFLQIKKGNWQTHMKFMWSAFGVSALFLVSYLIFHYQVGSVGFEGEGWTRPVYFTILITHIILAVVIVPMVFITLWRGMKERFTRHRKIAKYTWPLWMYVSVTGVVIYLFMAATGSYDKIM